MNVIGLSAFFHESACCLLRDGELVAAAAEERFSRVKHDPRLPAAAFRWCLEEAGLTIADLDAGAYYEQPKAKLVRQLWSGTPGGPSVAAHGTAPPGLPTLDAAAPERAIRERPVSTGSPSPGRRRLGGDAARAAILRRLQEGIEADLLPVFGEIVSLRVRAAHGVA